MQYKLKDLVGILPGVGPVIQENLNKIGIFNLEDLLGWYPRTYLDASKPVSGRSLRSGELQTVQLTIQRINKRRSAKGLLMLELFCTDSDETDFVIRFFNQIFLENKLKPGTSWLMIGKVERFTGVWTMLSPIVEEDPQILSIYAQTKMVNSKLFRKIIKYTLKNIDLEQDDLPSEIQKENHFPDLLENLNLIHQPQNIEQVELAQKRIAYEEVFWFFLKLKLEQSQLIQEGGIIIDYDLELLKELISRLPFTLTDSQRKATYEILQDLASGKIMSRLLNADVGAGKTIVAALVATMVAQAGYRSIFLVPTEILARQHLQSIKKVLDGTDFKVKIWTAAQKDDLSDADIVIGTHAVLQEGFELPKLGLVVIDEQQRFGVKQRQFLRRTNQNIPHFLSMTATPIPRTLALVLYGDLKVSFMSQKPINRLPVITELVDTHNKSEVERRIITEIQKGNQILIICPLIETAKAKNIGIDEGQEIKLFDEVEYLKEEKKTVIKEAERLRAEHPEYGPILVLHGKLKAQEKNEVMQNMFEKKAAVLVATSVVEVGVDLPSLTVILIEGAEHFGLAQLHQFRGRVGRNKLQAYCYLNPNSRSALAIQRLEALVEETDGFKIAEADLNLRGPGELSGQIQAGLPDFKMAKLTDLAFLNKVKVDLDDYIAKNPKYLDMVTNNNLLRRSSGLN